MATVSEIFKKVTNELFTVSTPWSFNSSGGGSASAMVFGVSGGVLYLKNDATKDEKKLWWGAGGASAGPLPGGGSFSTPDMFSSGLGQIRARTQDPLAFADMTGPICVLSVAAVGGSAVAGQGASASIYFMGIPTFYAITNVAVPLVLNWIASSAMSAKAIGMMYGRALGLDAGVSIEIGYAH